MITTDSGDRNAGTEVAVDNALQRRNERNAFGTIGEKINLKLKYTG